MSQPFDQHQLFDLMDDTRPVFKASGQWADMQAHLLVLYTLGRYCTAPTYGEPVALRPPLALEIGVRQGVSTLALLLGLRRANGRLVSLDIDPVETDVAKQVIQDAGLESLWSFYLEDSNDFIHTERCPKQLDLLWIDGDHRTPQPFRDFNNYAPLVRRNGIIAMHDYFVEPWRVEERGAQLCVEAIKVTGEFEVCVLPWCFGLTLMRKMV